MNTMTENSMADDAENNWQTKAAEKPDEFIANELSFQEWIARVVDGDQTALELLYEGLIGQVYGLALRITRRVQLAEEVAQDTFWQIWRQAPRFDPERGSAKAWVMTIARSRALDTLRRSEPNEYQFEAEALELIEASNDDTPPNLLVAVQQGQQLYTALASLDSMPRQLISLAFFRGLSHDEIAEYCNLPLGTVKSHIRRALLALRQTLTADATEVIKPHE